MTSRRGLVPSHTRGERRSERWEANAGSLFCRVRYILLFSARVYEEHIRSRSTPPVQASGHPGGERLAVEQPPRNKQKNTVQASGERHVAKAVCVHRVDHFSEAFPGRPDRKKQHSVRTKKKTLRPPPMSDTHAPVASLTPTPPSLARKTEQN